MNLERYQRQSILPDFGKKGQEKLRNSCVLVAGIGGLGSVVSMYLVYAGVGKVKIVDADTVEITNLNRQLLYTPEDLGKRKVLVAAKRLSKMNPEVEVVPCQVRIGDDGWERVLDGVDLVVDGLDNLEGRFAVNREVFNRGIPYIYGGVEGFYGMVTTLIPGETPCLSCVVRRDSVRRKPIPVLGPVAGFVASIEALEAIKLISGSGKLLKGRLLYIDGSSWDFTFIEISRRKECKICGGFSHDKSGG